MRNTIQAGDAYQLTRQIPMESIDCTVTSVPYWRQRQYLPPGHRLAPHELGNESDPDSYVANLSELFGLIFNRTRPSGALWVNVGDTMAASGADPLYTAGELLGLPWRLAEAIRRRGWRLVREVIWSKPDINPRASAAGPMISHEHVFLFARGADPYYDPVAISEPAKYPVPGVSIPALRGPRTVWEIPTARLNARKILGESYGDGLYFDRDARCPVHGDPAFGPTDPTTRALACSCSVLPQDFFATMPTRLAERCILATTSERGGCPSCGVPHRRVTRKHRVATRPGRRVAVDATGKARRDPYRHVTLTETVGWKPSCTCPTADPVPALVYDPFAGAGTTPMVAAALGRDFYAAELNPATVKLALARIGSPFERSFPA